MYERSSLARLKLHGRVLDRVEVECDGRLAHTYVLRQDFVETGAHPSDTEDLVNECLTITGTECAIIIVEQQSKQAKVSFRSRTDLDVAAIAEQFGGGGHKKASGAMLPGPLLRRPRDGSHRAAKCVIMRDGFELADEAPTTT